MNPLIEDLNLYFKIEQEFNSVFDFCLKKYYIIILFFYEPHCELQYSGMESSSTS